MTEEVCNDSELKSIHHFGKNFHIQNDEVFRMNDEIEEPKEEIETANDYKKVNKMDLVCGFVNKWVSRISITSAITQKQKGSYKTGSQELLSLLERVIKRKSNNKNNLNNKPGVVGLSNHGNTCYINSVVQCLSNCQTLTNFILSNEYKKSFNSQDNRLYHQHLDPPKKSKFKISKSRIQRQKGSSVIVDQFASLIKGVWYGRYSDDVSLTFKNQLSKMEKQFRGSYQQDSHEFLLWLMSKLHEDLALPLYQIDNTNNHHNNTNNNKNKKMYSVNNINDKLLNSNRNSYNDTSTRVDIKEECVEQNMANDSIMHGIRGFENGIIKKTDDKITSLNNSSKFVMKDEETNINDVTQFETFLKTDLKPAIATSTVIMTSLAATTTTYANITTDPTKTSVSSATSLTKTTTPNVTTVATIATTTTLATTTTATFTPPTPSTSIIHHLFQAHYKSTLTCLNCNHTSITIDPFLTISLPILPLENRFQLTVLVVLLNTLPNQRRMVVDMEGDSRVMNLKNKVSQATQLKSEQFILAEVSNNRIKCLPDNMMLHKTSHNNKVLQCIEVPVYNKADNHVIMVVLNRFENGIDVDMFGYPIVLHMHKSSCLLDMHQDLLFEVKQHICDGFEHYSFSKTFLDFLLVNPSNPHEHYYMSSDSYPLCSNAVERAVNSCPSDPKHIFVVAEWYQMSRNNFNSLMRQQYTDNKYLDSTIYNNNNPSCSLDDCLLLYTQQEQLCGENAWCCAGCGRRRVDSVKSLQLSTLPEVLVLHLKRFKNTCSHRSKLHTFISFPLTSLCLDKYLASKNNDSSHLPQHPQSPLYDLFAVCNHFGNLSDGHYTAYCKNSLDKEWYHFDDTQVCSIASDQIVSKHAYLLFYQKRSNQSNCSDVDKNVRNCVTCSGGMDYSDWACGEASCEGDINDTSLVNNDSVFIGKLEQSVAVSEFSDCKKDDVENKKERLDLNDNSSSSSSSSSPSVRHKRFCLPRCLMYSGRWNKWNKNSASKSKTSKNDAKIIENKKNNENKKFNYINKVQTINKNNEIKKVNEDNKFNENINDINFQINNSIISGRSEKRSDISDEKSLTEAQKLFDNLEMLESMQESTV